MDHYSQQKIKSAATDPEHVVRKAELDGVLASFGDLGDLKTRTKTSLVAAVNELIGMADGDDEGLLAAIVEQTEVIGELTANTG